MKAHWLKIIFIILIFTELGYSFLQHLNEPLDGDVSSIVYDYEEVLNDPLGISVFTKGEKYPSPNRYFIHLSMSNYCKWMPIAIQRFVEPVQSVYMACAWFKLLIQVLLLWMLAGYISNTLDIRKKQFLFAVLLIMPLFQMTQFNQYMGLVLESITYTFFYSMPLGVLLLFFYPFYQAYGQLGQTTRPIGSVHLVCLLCLMVMLSFSGPLVAPVVLLVCPFVVLCVGWTLYKKSTAPSVLLKAIAAVKSIPRDLLFFFTFFSLMCLYSLYIGTFSTENTVIPLADRYQQLSGGIFHQFTRKLGFPFLVLFIIANAVFLSRIKNEQSKKIRRSMLWVALFSLVYVLLLPLGGYRNYRPDIVRADTIMPITLALLYLFGLSTQYLLSHLHRPMKKYYSIGTAVFLLYFVIADEPNFGKNSCEKNALHQISQSTESVITLSPDCLVMSWVKIVHPAHSKENCQLLHHWGITEETKLYKQK